MISNEFLDDILTWKHWRAQILQKVVFKNWVIVEKDNAAPKNSSKFEIQIIWKSNCPEMSNSQIDSLLDSQFSFEVRIQKLSLWKWKNLPSVPKKL